MLNNSLACLTKPVSLGNSTGFYISVDINQNLRHLKTLTCHFLGMLQLPAKTHLLPHVPRSPGLHQEPGHGEGGQLCPLPLQVRVIGLWSHPASHRQDGTRRALRVSAVLLPLSWRLLQVAGLSGRCHASPDAPAQVHHHTAGQTCQLTRFQT